MCAIEKKFVWICNNASCARYAYLPIVGGATLNVAVATDVCQGVVVGGDGNGANLEGCGLGEGDRTT